MPKSNRECECERGARISLTTNSLHNNVTNIYEGLCDRDFPSVRAEIKVIQDELRIITKSIEDDEF